MIGLMGGFEYDVSSKSEEGLKRLELFSFAQTTFPSSATDGHAWHQIFLKKVDQTCAVITSLHDY
jgi:hypothetical protein